MQPLFTGAPSIPETTHTHAPQLQGQQKAFKVMYSFFEVSREDNPGGVAVDIKTTGVDLGALCLAQFVRSPLGFCFTLEL